MDFVGEWDFLAGFFLFGRDFLQLHKLRRQCHSYSAHSPTRRKTAIDLISKCIKATIAEVKKQETILAANGNQSSCLMCEDVCVLESHRSLCKWTLFCLIGSLVAFKVNIWQSTFSN